MKNKVELIGYYGGDLTHAKSAWTSTDRLLSEEKLGRVNKLLKMLADSQHFSPFEKSMLHFLVTCDNATHIQILKHRIGVSANVESARYRELKDKYYIPEDWPEDLKIDLDKNLQILYKKYHEYIISLQNRGYDRKRAKESARFILPYSNQLTMDISFNFRSFMHFQGLRGAEDAQLEIREIAKEMLRLVKITGEFDGSLAAYGY